MTAVKTPSAATDGNDDLQTVAVRQHLLGVPAARHDFAVAFEGDAFAGKLQMLE